jgi:hypothetical protein
MRCHEVDYELIGSEMQLVEVELDPGEAVIAEAGAMTYMEEDIAFETKMGDGSNPDEGLMGKLFSAGKRVFTGESIFTTHFSNRGSHKRRVAFAAPYPGNIVPLNMAQLGEKVICQKDAFLCAALGTRISITFNRRIAPSVRIVVASFVKLSYSLRGVWRSVCLVTPMSDVRPLWPSCYRPTTRASKTLPARKAFPQLLFINGAKKRALKGAACPMPVIKA